jgi:hypothetical protein
VFVFELGKRRPELGDKRVVDLQRTTRAIGVALREIPFVSLVEPAARSNSGDVRDQYPDAE